MYVSRVYERVPSGYEKIPATSAHVKYVLRANDLRSPYRKVPLMARILVVDDDPALRGTTGRLLAGSGHSVVEAASGADALQFFDEGSVDLVIMDIVMPQKGGIEAIMEIHALHPSIPAIIMSGKVPLGTDAVDNLMKRYGARAILSKPFTAAELAAAVATALAD